MISILLTWLGSVISRRQQPMSSECLPTHSIPWTEMVTSPRLMSDMSLSEEPGTNDVVHVICDGCANPVLVVNKNVLTYMSGHDIIRASDFRSIVDSAPDPQSGDEARCPFCGRELMTSLRNTWRKYKINPDSTIPSPNL